MNTLKQRIRCFLIVLLGLAFTSNAHAMDDDDPWLTKVKPELEYLPNHDSGILEWDVDAWMGRDLYKFWIKSSGEYAHNEVAEATIELVYSRAVYTTWDQQFGVRRDLKPDSPEDARTWVSYGYIGTAPYFVEVDARVFLGEESSSQLLVELEREIMLTQEWVLTPELDIVANGRTNAHYGEGSGLAELEFGVRLGYEHEGNRKFQPFVGVVAKQTFGGTRQFKKDSGEKTSSVTAMVGIHSWF